MGKNTLGIETNPLKRSNNNTVVLKLKRKKKISVHESKAPFVVVERICRVISALRRIPCEGRLGPSVAAHCSTNVAELGTFPRSRAVVGRHF